MLAHDAFAGMLGIDVTANTDGSVESELLVTDAHTNPHGTAHGAVVYGVAGAAIATVLNDAAWSGIVTDAHITYLAPGKVGDLLIARAEVTSAAQRSVAVRVHVWSKSSGVQLARVEVIGTRRPRQHTRPTTY